jgi:signal transduction histidine kinase
VRLRLWPRSLAARTALVLLVGLVVVQVIGLTIHALDRIDVQRLAQARDVALRVVSTYRIVMMTPPDRRAEVLSERHRFPGLTAEIVPDPPAVDLANEPPFGMPLLRVSLNLVPLMGVPHWRGLRVVAVPARHAVIVAMHLPDGDWLDMSVPVEPLSALHSPTFLAAFILMTVAAAGLTIWAVRRLTAPVRTLAAAAEALGRDVNAPPLPETGPSEVATAAAAFNTMAARIRRFVQDRTELLTAIGHDLRTPITRLKLRAEFVEDDEQRGKMLADLEELEAMVSATLAFGRDARTIEPVASLDLVELLRTVLDETGDARPDAAAKLAYEGPPHLTVRARSLSLKRAVGNLVSNAVIYGGGAVVRLIPPADGAVVIEIEDGGPGIPPNELDRVFEPFHRGEPSRNRETGGVGLGLSIARNILRAHGGDVTLANRPKTCSGTLAGGLKASVTLPV